MMTYEEAEAYLTENGMLNDQGDVFGPDSDPCSFILSHWNSHSVL
jgi:hypothetical protein